MNKFSPFVKPGGFIFLHDINYYKDPSGKGGDWPRKYWDEFEDPSYEKLSLYYNNGLGILRKK